MKLGVVGLPNVGKSTLFNALTKAGIAAENYPFCTIEPNVGIVEVPDARMQALAAAIRAVLTAALDAGGTTLRDYVDAAGAPGYFRLRLADYERAGQP